MKTSKIIFALAAAAVVSACSKEVISGDNINEEVPGGVGLFQASFGDETKVELNSSYQLLWEAGDEVSVFKAGDALTNSKYVAKSAGTTTLLEGDALASGNTYYAVYPYSTGNSFDGSSTITATVPATQTAVANGIPANVMVASATAEAPHLYFKNVGALVEFDITASGKVARVAISGNNGESVAGDVQISGIGSTPSWTAVNGSSTVVVTPEGATFDAGKYYALVLPQTFANGISIKLFDKDGNKCILKQNTSQEVLRSTRLPVGSIDDKKAFEFDRNIADAADFVNFISLAASDGTATWNVTADIDLSGINPGSAESFAGILGGGSHTVSGANLTGPLFTVLSGTVKDLTVGGKLTFSHIAGNYGFVAGTNSGTISNVTANGSIAADEDAFASPTTGAYVDMCIGAICGTNSGTVTGCTNNASFAIISDVSKYTPTYLGGIVGQQASATELKSCTNYGTVSLNNTDRAGLHISASCFVGGIIGGTKYGETVGAALTGCANSGNVEVVARDGSSSSPEIKLGGIAGYLDGTLDDCDNSGAISNSIPTETTAGNSLRNCTIAGVAGTVTGAISGCDNTGNVTASGSYCYSTAGTETQTFFGGVAGYAGSTVSSCTNTKPLTITAMMNSTSTSATHNGYFGGIAGYVVSTIDGCTNSGALGIQSTFCTGWVGGIAGYTLETIGATTLCSNSGDISYDFVNTEASGNQAKNAYIGGISGQHAGTDKTIKGDASVSSGKITVNNGFYNASNITYVGGITGHCTGAINGTAVSAAGRATYSGTITVNSELLVRVGGIVGETSKTLLNVCYSGKISIPDLGTKSCVGGFTGVKSGSVNMGGSTLTGTVTCTYAGEKNTTNNVRVGLCHGIVTGKMTTHSTTIGAAAKLTATGGMYAGIFAGSASVALTMGTSTNAFTYRPGVTFNGTSISTVDDLTDGFLVERLYNSGAITRTNLKVE